MPQWRHLSYVSVRGFAIVSKMSLLLGFRYLWCFPYVQDIADLYNLHYIEYISVGKFETEIMEHIRTSTLLSWITSEITFCVMIMAKQPHNEELRLPKTSSKGWGQLAKTPWVSHLGNQFTSPRQVFSWLWTSILSETSGKNTCQTIWHCYVWITDALKFYANKILLFFSLSIRVICCSKINN